MADILVVDDDQQICKVFERFLTEEGHSPRIASNAEDALGHVVRTRPDLVLMDVRMPGLDGLEALAEIRRAVPDAYVVIMTAFGTSQTSIEAMRLGAFEYLMKPLDLDVLRAVIDKALDAQSQGREVTQPTEDYSLVNLVGQSPEMQEAYKRIGLLAANDVPALLVGEQGVGKHLVAKTIHFNSPRKERPFVAVHCRSLPARFLEAELFEGKSHPAGTGGASRLPGKLEAATGGTLFLDQIERLPLPLQARILSSRLNTEYPGSAASPGMKAPARIIAATETDLEQCVREGTLLEELLQVLGTISIRLPPLRSRLDDLTDLVTYFVASCNAELGKSLKGVEPRVTEAFRRYSWPGNVSELSSVIKRAAILARGEVITLAEIEGSLQESRFVRREETRSALELAVRRTLGHRLNDERPDPEASHFHEIVAEVERILVQEALDMTSGNQLKAAELLGLNRNTLRKRMLR